MNLVEQRVVDFVAATASKEPTPGGGAIAALTAATGAALAEMVANLTFGKKGYEEVQSEMEELQTKSEAIRNRMLELSQADADVFNIFMNALVCQKIQMKKRLRVQQRFSKLIKTRLWCLLKSVN